MIFGWEFHPNSLHTDTYIENDFIMGIMEIKTKLRILQNEIK